MYPTYSLIDPTPSVLLYLHFTVIVECKKTRRRKKMKIYVYPLSVVSPSTEIISPTWKVGSACCDVLLATSTLQSSTKVLLSSSPSSPSATELTHLAFSKRNLFRSLRLTSACTLFSSILCMYAIFASL